jgi:hypothetical protein
MTASFLRAALAVTASGWLHFGQTAELPDAEARRLAQEMQQTVRVAEARMMKAVAADDRYQFPAVVGPVQNALKTWPVDHRDNRASFPYWGCKQMAVTFIQVAQAWQRADKSTGWRERLAKTYQVDSKECAKAIMEPDLSLKDLH